MRLKRKMLLVIGLLCFFSILIPTLNASIMVITSRDGSALTADKVNNALDELMSEATNFGNDDGWGIVAFRLNGQPIPGTNYLFNPTTSVYTETPNNYRFAGSRQIYADPKFQIAINTILNNSPRIIMIHARNATEAPYNVVDPQPMVVQKNNRYYAFIHRGTIDNTADMNTYTNSIDPALISLIETTNNVSGSNYKSAHYYAYLMAQLNSKNYEPLHAFKNMMRHNAFKLNYANKTFVLCDGFQNYAYTQDGNQNDLASNIFSENNTNPYFISTITPYINLGTVQTPNLEVMERFDAYGTQYFPVNGRPTEQRFYHYSETEAPFGIASMNRQMSSAVSWRWESFPILDPSLSPTAVLSRFGNSTKSYYQGTLPNRPTINYLFKDANGDWNRNGSYTTNHHNGHKIYVPSGTDNDNLVIGNIISENITVNLTSGSTTWLGYWLMDNQSLAQALGSNLSKVANVWAERWHYQDQSGSTKLDPVIIPTMNANSLIMEFGKSYIIELKSGESIANFTWANNRTAGTKNDVALYLNTTYPEYFSYVDQPEYETIMIDNLDEFQGIEEIAVYAGLDCVGATKISTYPVQLLAYTKSYEGIPLTFRAITNNKSEGEITLIGKLIGDTKNSSLKAGEFAYAGINVYIEENIDTMPVSSSINNVSAYPNPCNPSTTIKFSLSESENVCIDIFNVKGQKVKTLLNQKLAMGTHGIVWNGSNENNQTVGNGVYYYRISTHNASKTGKILILK